LIAGVPGTEPAGSPQTLSDKAMIPSHSVSVLQNLIQDARKALERGDEAGTVTVLTALHQVAEEGIPGFQVATPASQLLNEAISLLDQAISKPDPATDLAGDLKLYPALGLLYSKLLDIREFFLALANGDLSEELRIKGYLAGTLKALQANLRHLTWQTQRIASGDFSQRVDFMGEFSDAFNSMVIRLDECQKEIQEKQAELICINEELRAEIDLRKKTEESLRQSEELYHQLAIIDPLTGIFNRRQFYQLAMKELDRICRYFHPITVIMFDLDHFKRINDTYGHAAGDQVLQAFAGLVRTSLRTVDIFARYGGEEFILLMPETDLEAGVAIAERLRRKVARTSLPIGQNCIKITFSAGASALDPSMQPISPQPETLDQFIAQADKALYEAKRTGRNRVNFFSPITQVLRETRR
jgi:diguanylate cyclase (GGDEF)-like protein